VGERQLEGLEEKKTHRFEYRENIGSKPQASRAHEPTDDTETEALIDPMRSYGHTREIPTTEAYHGQHMYQIFSKMLQTLNCTQENSYENQVICVTTTVI
jgi:hypothetical protein